MSLAMRLGRTLHELEQSMTAEEFGLWQALYRQDPWGETRADLRAGIVASTIANYAGMTRAKHAEPAKPADYMPYIERDDNVEHDPDPMKHFGAAHGG
jgi:hypothetical protein